MIPPLIIHKDVEVTSIDARTKTFTLLVTLKLTPFQWETFGEKIISVKVIAAVKYLVAEGFIPDPKTHDWYCIINAVVT